MGVFLERHQPSEEMILLSVINVPCLKETDKPAFLAVLGLEHLTQIMTINCYIDFMKPTFCCWKGLHFVTIICYTGNKDVGNVISLSPKLV